MSRLFAQVFQHPNFGGEYRWLVDDVGNFQNDIGFNDTVTSIRVYKGNNYVLGDKIRFFENPNYDGGYLDLGPGHYPNIKIQPFSFDDKISSANFYPAVDDAVNLTVRLRIRLYENSNYSGQFREVLQSEANFANIGFDNKVSSIRVFAGEDYATGWVCDFYEHPGYAGGLLQPGGFPVGTNLANIHAAPYSFGDKISSVRIYLAT